MPPVSVLEMGRARLLGPLFVVLVSTLVSAASARAGDAILERDSDRTHGPVEVHEDPIELRLVLGTTIARGVMRRGLTNVTSEVGEGTVDVSLPEGAAATGLVTWVPDLFRAPRAGAATASSDDAWTDRAQPLQALLLAKGPALAAYGASRARVGPAGADATLLEWTERGALDLRVEPLLPGKKKRLDVAFEVPLTYREGAAHLTLEPDVDPSTVELWPASLDDELTVDGRVVPPGVRLTLLDAVDVAVRRRDAAPLAWSEVTIPLLSGQSLSRVELRASEPLEPAPRGAHVVLAFDASRSIEDPRLLLAAARAYLDEMPEAKVVAIRFARRAEPLWAEFVPVEEALRRLAAKEIPRGNGSEMGEALKLADAIFAGEPSAAAVPAHRVVVLGDLATRGSLDPAEVKPLASDALVHLVAVRGGPPALVRNDDDAWSAVAVRTGGLAWSGAVSLAPADAQKMARAYEELAHPMQIDHVVVRAAMSQDDLEIPESFGPGEGFQRFEVQARAARVTDVRYELWGRVVHAVPLVGEGDMARIWAGLAVVHEPFSSTLTEAEIAELAWRGRVVSPATSFVTAPAGKRAVSEPWSGGDFTSVGLSGFGTIGRQTHPPPRGLPSSFESTLVHMMQAAVTACGRPPGAMSLRLETTREEIVDVPEVSGAADPGQEACVREAAWSLVLPHEFAAVERHTFFLTL